MKRRVTIVYECGAPEDVFEEEENVEKERWEELMALIPHGLPCDGGGVPGRWCIGQCRWEIPIDVVEDETNWSRHGWNDE